MLAYLEQVLLPFLTPPLFQKEASSLLFIFVTPPPVRMAQSFPEIPICVSFELQIDLGTRALARGRDRGAALDLEVPPRQRAGARMKVASGMGKKLYFSQIGLVVHISTRVGQLTLLISGDLPF